MTDEIVETAKATQEVAKVTVKSLEVSEKIGRFFAKVLGEPIETATGILDDKLKFIRWERQNRFIDQVQKINHDRGVEGKEVAVMLKFAIPIIENASLEENDLLQDLWARLMSSAQGKESSNRVRSAFIDIIKQLEVIDVMILSFMFDGYVNVVEKNYIHNGTPGRVPFPKADIINALKVSENIYEESIDNLMRVRFVCSEVKSASGLVFKDGAEDHATVDKGYNSLCLTSLGLSFIITCIKDKI